MNRFDEMRMAVTEAEHTLRAADSVADDMAGLLRGRLRKCSPWHLAALKRELSQFDAHRKMWKEDK